MAGTNVIEHRRVIDGDWIKVQTVGDDLLEHAQATVIAYNDASGVGDWRVRPLDGATEPAAPSPAPAIQKPTLRQRLRFWWILRTSKRG